MKVTIFGTGYVGLVQAAVLAEVGHQVCCVDVDDERIAALRQGQIPFYEPGLAPLVESHLASGRLSFTVDPAIGVAHADLLLIAVGTPADEDGSADLQHVLAVADTIGRLMSSPKLVVTKSANSTSKCDTRLCRLTVLFEYLDRLPESETFPRS